MALLSAMERSVHLHGPSRLPVVNYFSIMTVAKHIMTVAKHIMTAVKKGGVIHVFRITPQVVQPTRLPSDVNVLGGLFLCSSTRRMLVTNEL